jgi:hypothetical protein
MTTFGGDETTLAADAATAPERDWRSVQPVGVEVALLWNRLDNSLIVSMWNPACDLTWLTELCRGTGPCVCWPAGVWQAWICALSEARSLPRWRTCGRCGPRRG